MNDSLNILDIYMEEAKSFPLLTKEDEKELFTKISKVDSLKIVDLVKIKNIKLYKLDLKSIFLSLTNIKDYNKVIKILMHFYTKMDKKNNSNILLILNYYLKLANKLNRSLNKNELLKYFKIKDADNILEESELLAEIKDYLEYFTAHQAVINSNLRLVVSIANKYSDKADILDLINEGNFGLFIAIDKFKLEYNTKFSTYATYWINQKIRVAIPKQKINPTSKYYLEKIWQLNENIKNAEQKDNKTLSDAEIAQKFNIDITALTCLKNNYKGALSLNVQSANENVMMVELIQSDFNTEKEVFNHTLKTDIDTIFSNLGPREIEIIKARYGFYNYPMTYKEIGDKLGISGERVRVIEKRALERISSLAKYNNKYESLKDYLRF